MQDIHFIEEGDNFSFKKAIHFIVHEINLRQVEGSFDLDEMVTAISEPYLNKEWQAGASNILLRIDTEGFKKFVLVYEGGQDDFKLHFETDADFKFGSIALQSNVGDTDLIRVIQEWIELKKYSDRAEKQALAEQQALAERQAEKRAKADAEIAQELLAHKQKQKQAAKEKAREENGCLCKHEHARVDSRPGDRSFHEAFVIGKLLLLEANGHYYTAFIYQCKNCKAFFAFEQSDYERGGIQNTVSPVTPKQAELFLLQADFVTAEVAKDGRRFQQILAAAGLKAMEQESAKEIEPEFDYKTKCRCAEYGRFKKHPLDYYSRNRENLLWINFYDELRIERCKICGTGLQEYGQYGRYGIESRVITLVTPQQLEFVSVNRKQMERDKESLLRTDLSSYITQNSKQ